MKYVVFEKDRTKSYLPLSEFMTYIDKEILDRFTSVNGITDKEKGTKLFCNDLANAFNKYAPKGKNCTLTVERIVNSFGELDNALRQKRVDECRLSYAEYCIDSYTDPFPTLNKIANNIKRHNSDIPVRNIVCEKDLKSIKASLKKSFNSITKKITSSNESLWDDYAEYAVRR